jgi:Arc-like DNA binding domain
LAGETYRFLLRIREEMRQKLVSAAAKSGRSLNGELVFRLEQSLRSSSRAGAGRFRRPLTTKGEGMRKTLLRPAAAVAVIVLVGLAVFLASAMRSSSPSTRGQQMLAFTKGDPDAIGGNAQSVISQPEEARTPETSGGAAEKYANNAYPADSIPFELTQAAVSSWNASVQNSNGKAGKNVGTWQLVGPDQATYPGVLNRSGALYHASGRITVLSLKPGCSPNNCEMLLGAAGGGLWLTDKAMSKSPKWEFVSGNLPSNNIGGAYRDTNNDPSGNTIYVGTGEPNASADSGAGFGIFKSTNGGRTWTPIANQAPFLDRSISEIRVVPGTPGTWYVGTTRGVRGVSSVSGGAASLKPGAQAWGVWKTTDAGATWTFLFDGGPLASSCNPPNSGGANGCSARGANDIELDPRNSNTVYAALFGRGIWRSTDAGATWTQIFTPQVPQFTSPFFSTTDRTQFAVTLLPNGKVRIYTGDGDLGPDGGETAAEYSRVWRTDDADTATAAGNAGWISLTSNVRGDPHYGTYDYCWAQCWYDNDIFTPKGQPNTVYVIGAYRYDEAGGVTNGRGVVVSYTAGDPNPDFKGGAWADLTRDATPSNQPDGIHPDQHEFQIDQQSGMWWEGSDGGIMRADGQYVDDSSECLDRGLAAQDQVTCQMALSHVPHDLSDDMNKGLSTLQFQSVAISQQRPMHQVIGGTQDNGTFDWDGSMAQQWWQVMYGDGGQSGIDATDDSIMFNEFTGKGHDTNFRGGQPKWWVVVSGKFYAPNTNEAAPFYSEIEQDPRLHGQRFFGMQHVWRTQDNGGDQAYLEATCPEFITFSNDPACGDYVALGDVNGAPHLRNEPGDLTSATNGYGADRAGGSISTIGRQRSDATGNVMWVSTSTGRVFITTNAAAPAPTVTFTRLDDKSTTDPARFPSGIWVDPANPNHAWISYGGYQVNTPAQPGHVFDVTWNGTTAVWRNLNVESGNGDYPVNDLVRDDVTGNLYASTDFGVLSGTPVGINYTWAPTPGLPVVEVPGLRIHPEQRVMYAATHGRSVWRMILPG